MSRYFTYFPNVQHDLTNNGQRVLLRNIMRRFSVLPSVMNNKKVYNEYTIQAGERPDTVARKYYGDPGLAWLVLLFNEKHDAIFDWPIFNYDFEQYIKGKYGSVPAAQAQVYEYRKVLTAKRTKTEGTIIQKRYVVVDQTTYNSLSESQRELITAYDWELEEQEKKRQIKILDRAYLPQVQEEVKYILRNGI